MTKPDVRKHSWADSAVALVDTIKNEKKYEFKPWIQ